MSPAADSSRARTGALFFALASACSSPSEPLPKPRPPAAVDAGGENVSRDAGLRRCPPEIATVPVDGLHFRISDAPVSKELEVFNLGCEDLVIERARIGGPEGLRDHPSVDDFALSPCTSGRPCPPICGSREESCATPSLTFSIVYSPNDLSSTDLADLLLRTNDPERPEVIIVLSAE